MSISGCVLGMLRPVLPLCLVCVKSHGCSYYEWIVEDYGRITKYRKGLLPISLQQHLPTHTETANRNVSYYPWDHHTKIDAIKCGKRLVDPFDIARQMRKLLKSGLKEVQLLIFLSNINFSQCASQPASFFTDSSGLFSNILRNPASTSS